MRAVGAATAGSKYYRPDAAGLRQMRPRLRHSGCLLYGLRRLPKRAQKRLPLPIAKPGFSGNDFDGVMRCFHHLAGGFYA